MEELKETLALERWIWKNMLADMPSKLQIFQMCLGEFFGTGILCIFGCLATLTAPKSSIPDLLGSTGFGMAVMLIITIFGQISQAHLNPAVTICACLLGGLPILMAPFYVVSQCIGAIVGFWFGKGFLVEYFATSVLIFVCCGVWDPRQSTRGGSISLKFGFGITALSTLVGSFTGCSMNPARTLGPALLTGGWGNHHWIYWVAPNIAGFFNTLLYMVCCGTPRLKK